MSQPVLIPSSSWRYTLRWRTDVVPSADGTEQRACTGGAAPRAYVSGPVQLGDADARALHAWLTTSPRAAAIVPLAHEATPTASAFTGGAVTIDGTYCDWLAVGRRVLVVGAGSSYTTTISGYSAPTLTLAAGPSSGAYPAGATHVYPCEDVYLEDGQAVKRWPVTLSQWQLNGRVQEVRALTGTGGAAVTTFDDLPVLVDRPLDDGDDTETYDSGVMWADAGGAVAVSGYQTVGARMRSGSWLVRSAAQRQAWKVFLSALRGRWKPFLSPTWRPDLTLQAQPAGGASAIRVDQALADLGPLTRAGRVQLEYADGSVDYRTIGTPSDAGAYRSIPLGAALPGSIPGGSIRCVSLLERVRLASDDVEIEYGGGWLGRISLQVVTLAGELFAGS